MISGHRALLVGGALLLGALLFWVVGPQLRVALEPFGDAGTWRQWREWIRAFGVLAPLVSIALSVAQLVPLPIPAPTVPLANGWLFGIWGGTLVTWLGVVLNGVVGYLVARGPGRQLFLRFIDRRHLRRAEQALEDHGAVAVVVARLFPVLPFSAVSVAAGLLHMPWRAYLLATAIGVLPSAFALALIGWQLSRGALDWVQVAVAAAILGALALAAIPLARWFRSV